MELTPNAISILRERYLEPDETPEARFKAVADRVARCEEEPEFWSHLFYTQLLEPLVFLPNSPCIANCRRETCMSACFVMSPEDNLESIYKVSTDASRVIASGGGMGFGLSKLREEGAPVSNVQKLACGPVSVLRKYSEDSHMVAQGFRLGANMAQLDVDHPDIEKFIHVKDDYTSITNFNISVRVSDAFMEAVKRDGPWDLISRYTGEVVRTVQARDIWDAIVQSAHRTGDPGVVFVDRVHETNPNPHLGRIESSNPCGEENLENYGSCCLGSINLDKFVVNGDVDWKHLEEVVRLAVRFLDDVIDSNVYPTPEIDDMAHRTRRIGLGVMGWADMLVRMDIRYSENTAERFAEEVGEFIMRHAIEESQRLGVEKGSFPEYPKSLLYEADKERRNSSVITYAPTGTISRIAGCSSGIEPYYDLIWESRILWDNSGATATMLDCPAPLLEELKARDKTVADLKQAMDANEYDPFGIDIHDGKYVTTHDIASGYHIGMVAAFQKYVTNSISKTINVSNDTTPQQIDAAMRHAHFLGCKSITIYRDGSRDVQVLNSPTTTPHTTEIVEAVRMKRPSRLVGSTYRVSTGHGTMYVTVNGNDVGRPVECFVTLGKSGGCAHSNVEAIGRLISVALQHQVPIDTLLAQLTSISCGHIGYQDGRMINSVPDGIAHVLTNFLGDNMLQTYRGIAVVSDGLCTSCGGLLIRQEGCETCQSCAQTKCG